MKFTRVLIVDDHVLSLGILSGFLRNNGEFEVFSTTRPKQALEMAKSPPPFDIVISDIEMPEMRGPELISEIRKFSPQTACILITGYVENMGTVPPEIPLLQKPITKTELLATIRSVLAEQRMTLSSSI